MPRCATRSAAHQWLKAHPEWRKHADLIIKPPSAEELIGEYPDCGLRDAQAMAAHWVWYGEPKRRAGYTGAALYVQQRREGKPHDPFLVRACIQKSAALFSDAAFFEGHTHFAEFYGEAYAADVKRRLAAQGCNLGPNDEYLPELAGYRGDPAAVIDASRGRAYIRKRCEELGYHWNPHDDDFEALPPEKDPFEDCPLLADDLVQESISEFRQEDPDAAARMSEPELREMVIEKHGFHS